MARALTREEVLDKPVEQLTTSEWELLTNNEKRWALDYLRFRRDPPEWLK